MEKQDARKLPAAAQEQLRKQAIRLRSQGKTYQEIADIVGVSRNTVWKWCRKYKAEGIKALKSKPRGRPLGTRRAMTADQEAEIQTLICDNTPDQMKLTFALWTRQAVQELIYSRSDGQLMAVEVRSDTDSFRVGEARPLFRIGPPQPFGPGFSISPVGQQLLVSQIFGRQAETVLYLIVNWPAELESP